MKLKKFRVKDIIFSKTVVNSGLGVSFRVTVTSSISTGCGSGINVTLSLGGTAGFSGGSSVNIISGPFSGSGILL